MRCVDVNVLVYAHRVDTPRHIEWREWLDSARRDGPPLGLIPSVASGFVRIVTHPKVFVEPSSTEVALGFVDALRASPTVVDVPPGPDHWPLVAQLCRDVRATGNRVPDAALAATAIEHGASFVTADRGFLRFPGIRLEHPI